MSLLPIPEAKVEEITPEELAKLHAKIRGITPTADDTRSNNPAQPTAGPKEKEKEGKGEKNPFENGLDKIDFEDCVELLAFFDGKINNGEVILHKWQVEIGEELCRTEATSDKPLRFCLCAANGSGKDQYIIVPFAVWFLLCNKQSLVVITSAGGTQLTNQTERHLSSLCNAINVWFQNVYGTNQVVFKVVQRRVECLLTGSVINMFATDEEGKAEGYHPLTPGGKFAMILNEAKSIKPDIFRALKRCSGYTHWLEVSSPGEPKGDFYEHFKRWPRKRRVDFFDCPHMSRDDFDEDKFALGEHSFTFRSKWLALFTTVGGNYVIPQDVVDKLRRYTSEGVVKERYQEWPIRIGIDLAAGGAENVISAWRGNKQIRLEASRFVDTTRTAEWISTKLTDIGLKKDHEFIFADDGGVGHAIIDMLQRMGWNIKRIKNNWAARNKRDYKNIGAELWQKFRRLVEECVIIPLEDRKQWEQFGMRRYKVQEATDKLQLEAKVEAIAEGLPSPDRADACVLAFTDVPLDTMLDGIYLQAEPVVKKRKLSQEEIEDILFNGELENVYSAEKNIGKSQTICGSLQVAMKDKFSNPERNLVWHKN